MKTNSKKLRLGRETVRSLTATQLGQAVGGSDDTSSSSNPTATCTVNCSVKCTISSSSL